MAKKYKLYAIDNYKASTQKFIDTKYVEYNLKNLVDELEIDKGYHMRICPDKNYVFFGDCDKFNGSFNEFAELLMDFLKKYYKIKVLIDEISYTENEGVEGSFHYSIPKFYASCKKLKEIHEKFFEINKNIFCRKENKTVVKVIDTSIYSNKWFRYPLQKKGSVDGVRHIIKHGGMTDFVVEYIPKNSICINDKEYIGVKVTKTKLKNNNNSKNDKMKNLFANTSQNLEKNNTVAAIYDNFDENIDANGETNAENFKETITSSFKRNLLREILSRINAYDDYADWTHVGMALKNESADNLEFFDLWNEWSKQSEKYEGTCAYKKKWNSFKKMRGYSMDYLVNLLKIHDPKKYAEIQAIISMQKIVKDNNQQYSKNICTLKKLKSTAKSHNLIFTDEFCPIHDDIHSDDEGYRHFEININGTGCMKCTNEDCIGKMCPADGIAIGKNQIRKIFIQNNNNNINVTNNYGTTAIFDVRSILGKDVKIFEDAELNRLVIDSLYEDDCGIADAIAYVNNDKLCFVDSAWYFFDGNLWKQNDNIVTKAILKFTVLFTEVKKFVTDSKEIFGVEKRSHVDQINKFVGNVKNMRKNKGIILMLEEKLTKKNTFDSNMNLIGFSNGVYDFEKMEIREGNNFDMIKSSCGYDYNDSYEDKQNIIDILTKIFPNKESMEFFLSYVALAMCGKNNSKLLLILKWTNIRYRSMLIRMIVSTFGKYCCTISDLLLIISNRNKIPINLSRLKPARIVVAEFVKRISNNEICQLIDANCIKHQNNKKIVEEFEIHFSTMCMCENDPIIDDNIEKNTIQINTLNSEYEDVKFNSNDFFLLLVECVKNTKLKTYSIDQKLIKIDDRNDAEKMCCEFMKDCIIKSNGREKCIDVYIRYTEWLKSRNYEDKKRLCKVKLFAELRKNGIDYTKSTRFGGKYSSAFIGISIIQSHQNV